MRNLQGDFIRKYLQVGPSDRPEGTSPRKLRLGDFLLQGISVRMPALKKDVLRELQTPTADHLPHEHASNNGLPILAQQVGEERVRAQPQ